MKRFAATFAAGSLLMLGMLAFEPAAQDSGTARASQFQYVVSTEENPCDGCCRTGYCCTVPENCNTQ